MQRVTRRTCEDGPLLEEQETEGQRRLHSLLLQQLHTDVDMDRCVAKRRCFAPAAVYRPFGQQAAGVRSLSQFQALQDGEKEAVSLRELGLTEPEIQTWRSRDAPEAAEKSHGVSAAPGAKEQRLQVIRDKMAARAELLARPQRFAASRPLSRREMEIERSLFQGSDRRGFLTALYHRDEESQEDQQGASSSDPMDCVYRDVLRKEEQDRALKSERSGASHLSTDGPDQSQRSGASHLSTDGPDQSQRSGASHLSADGPDQSQRSEGDSSQSGDTPEPDTAPPVDESDSQPERQRQEDLTQRPRPRPPEHVDLSRPIGRLRGAAAAAGVPLAVTGRIESVPDEDILKNRESEDAIRSIPRFRNYRPGNPSKVLCVKNLSAQASLAQLVALFSRFEREGGPSVVYRLLTGRMRGQAFITLPDAETAHNALRLVHGYRLLGKPLVVEFGRDRQEEEKQEEEEGN